MSDRSLLELFMDQLDQMLVKAKVMSIPGTTTLRAALLAETSGLLSSVEPRVSVNTVHGMV